jgi:hypothetical protein
MVLITPAAGARSLIIRHGRSPTLPNCEDQSWMGSRYVSHQSKGLFFLLNGQVTVELDFSLGRKLDC